MILRLSERNAASLRVIALALAFGLLSAPASAQIENLLTLEPGPAGASDSSPTPDACFIIFPSEDVAAMHCPTGAKAVIAYDFWKNEPLGWSCDCSHTPASTIEASAPGVRD